MHQNGFLVFPSEQPKARAHHQEAIAMHVTNPMLCYAMLCYAMVKLNGDMHQNGVLVFTSEQPKAHDHFGN